MKRPQKEKKMNIVFFFSPLYNHIPMLENFNELRNSLEELVFTLIFHFFCVLFVFSLFCFK